MAATSSLYIWEGEDIRRHSPTRPYFLVRYALLDKTGIFWRQNRSSLHAAYRVSVVELDAINGCLAASGVQHKPRSTQSFHMCYLHAKAYPKRTIVIGSPVSVRKPAQEGREATAVGMHVQQQSTCSKTTLPLHPVSKIARAASHDRVSVGQYIPLCKKLQVKHLTPM